MQIPCVYLPGPAPAVSVANSLIMCTAAFFKDNRHRNVRSKIKHLIKVCLSGSRVQNQDFIGQRINLTFVQYLLVKLVKPGLTHYIP